MYVGGGGQGNKLEQVASQQSSRRPSTSCPGPHPPLHAPLSRPSFSLSTLPSVILKPSEKVPGAASVLARLITEAGIPKGVFQV